MDIFDLFSVSTRLYPPWQEALEFQKEAGEESLINVENIGLECRRHRLHQLKTLEKQHGFVYFGEKQWLNSLEAVPRRSYGKWVRHALETSFSEVFPEDAFYLQDGHWVGAVNGASIPPVVDVETSRWFHTDGESVHYYIKSKVLEDKRLVQAYHILHNICYYLEKAGHFFRARGSTFCNESDKVSLWAVYLTPNVSDSRFWDLGLMAYGGLIECPFFEHAPCLQLANKGISEANIKLVEAEPDFAKKDGVVSEKPFWL